MNISDAVLLVVEDDPDLREVMVDELQRNKLRVLSASNGAQALEIAKKNRIHLILTDITMPGIGGIELMRSLRKTDSTLPIFFFISGYSDLSPEEAISVETENFFSKPFDCGRLMANVFKCLEQLKKDT